MTPEFGSRNALCSNCGAHFDSDAGNAPCPWPSDGVEYIHCGKGRHMFDVAAPPITSAADRRGIRSSFDLTHDPDRQFASVREIAVPTVVVVDEVTGVLRCRWEKIA